MIRLLLSGIKFYWKSHIGILLGAALASAVLTGSLLVGDSVDGSLRKFALQRLGSIEYAMATPNRFFAADLAERIPDDAAALLQLRGMALGEEQQINQVQVLGCTSNFWSFAGLDFRLAGNEVALNRKLAAALGVDAGDDVSLRIEKPGLLPRDAPLSSQKDDRSVRGRFTVARVLDDHTLGNFSLTADQTVPYNAFVSYQWLEEQTELEGKANMLVSDQPSELPWKPADFGLRFREEESIVQLESDGIYLEPEASRAALSIPGAQGSLTYLVNSIGKAGRSTPYSFVLAKEGTGLKDFEIIINQWLSNELKAGVGDAVVLTYFELLPDGSFAERERTFSVRSVVPMEALELERRLAPAFPGLTDVDRCSDWDVGIPMDEAQLEDDANEQYWNAYKQTPKAMVSLKAGQAMWSNRFGSLTGVRWDETDAEAAFCAAFDPVAAGYVFQPVREQALAAVEKAMDFGLLFVGMSFFLIIASLLLTGLLFVFSIQQRAEEMGILLATGWRPRQVRDALLVEGGMIALVGSLGGAWLGIGYTRLLIAGLSNYWTGALAHSSIEYFGRMETVAVGAVASFICALSAIAIAVWRQAKHPARELLMADFSQEFQPSEDASDETTLPLWLAAAGFTGAVGIAAYALIAKVHSVTMPFFGAGALLLISGMLVCSWVLRSLGRRERLPHAGAMALRNIARRRGRSLTVIGLLACGTFLVFAVSSMKEDVTAHADEPWSGTGGFAWFGASTLPVSHDFGGVRLRVRDGDDASCLNLNRARTPRLLGVDPTAMAARKAFCADEDIWDLLNTNLPEDVVPALVGDADTAMWGLEARTGIEEGDELEYVDDAGRTFRVKLVGHLPMRLSVFQGSLLISEKDFTERFPSEEGYRMFLLDAPVENRRYERMGLDVIPSTERLLEFYAVESTYLAMFLVLGALGLAVGSLGMGVVVLRNIQDRRAETALLRAVGYEKSLLFKLLFNEHGFLMLGGLVVGIGSAAVAMVPALFISQSNAPVGTLLTLLVLVMLCGIVCIAIAIGIAMREEPLRGLRNE
jgi:ABC-type antimicrobial peptide transport system permease subunit